MAAGLAPSGLLTIRPDINSYPTDLRFPSDVPIIGFQCPRLFWVERGNYCSFAYSALACFRMGMSGSASFQSVRKSL